MAAAYDFGRPHAVDPWMKKSDFTSHYPRNVSPTLLNFYFLNKEKKIEHQKMRKAHLYSLDMLPALLNRGNHCIGIILETTTATTKRLLQTCFQRCQHIVVRLKYFI